ncbi:MAG: hypothetical protein U0X87_15020 [Anaerolineales bacterium]
MLTVIVITVGEMIMFPHQQIYRAGLRACRNAQGVTWRSTTPVGRSRRQSPHAAGLRYR